MRSKNFYFLKWLRESKGNLSEKVARSIVWVSSLQLFDRSLVLAKTIVLARLLNPEDFGVFGIALLVLYTMETFSLTGFNSALIQRKGNIADYLDSAWTIEVIRGFFIALVLFLLSGQIAIFFNTPSASIIIKVLGISSFIKSFNNISAIYLEKEFIFQKFFKYKIFGTLIETTTAVIFAFIFKSIWALVIGFLAGNLVTLVMSYIVYPYKPKIKFSKVHLRKLFSFSKWVLISSMMVFLIIHGDDFFAGKFFGITVLAYYQMAYKFSNIPAKEITGITSRISFSVYSKLQNNRLKLKEIYLKVVKIISFIAYPITGLIILLSNDFVKIFLGKNWEPIIVLIKVLAIWGLIRTIGETTGSLLLGIGKPKILAMLHILQVVLIMITIYPFSVKWGILGTAFSVVLSSLVMNIIRNFIIRKILQFDSLVLYKIIFIYPVIIIIIPCASILLLKFFFPVINILFFIMYIIIFIVFFIVSSFFINLITSYKITNDFREFISILKKSKEQLDN